MSSELLRAEKSHIPLDHVFVDELWHDGDGHGGGGGAQNVLDLRVLKGPNSSVENESVKQPHAARSCDQQAGTEGLPTFSPMTFCPLISQM